MRTNLNVLPADNPSLRNAGGIVWHRLRSEREEICEALLKECAPGHGATLADEVSNECAMNAANWHQELLQARLKKVDDALDRLMSGKYGECSKCGKWIEDTKLDFDPAIAFCIDCWDRMQTIH
ncbi:MAG TPA: TraR/DksA C4-type zinc finger protein [Pyrinomonadaceae bacterium]|nr:TraR/DksA C4-type zinc finger protein [Pyrinomonadaceae bacterium]